MLLVVPLTANRDMGLDEPGVIDQTLAPAQIHVGLEGIKGRGRRRLRPVADRRRGRIPRSTAMAAAMLADLRPAPPAAAILARPGCHAGWQRAWAEIRPNIATTTTISKG